MRGNDQSYANRREREVIWTVSLRELSRRPRNARHDREMLQERRPTADFMCRHHPRHEKRQA